MSVDYDEDGFEVECCQTCGLPVADDCQCDQYLGSFVGPDRDEKPNGNVIKSRRHGFMDMVDFQHELGEALGGNKIYPNVEDFKQHNPCWNSCGIIEVEVRMVREVEPQELMRGGRPITRAELDAPAPAHGGRRPG